MALLAALTWGIGYGLLAEGVKLLGWQAASLVQFSVLAVCCLLLILFTRKRYETNFSTIESSIKNPFILGSAITQQAGAVLLNIGLSGDETGGSIIVALSSCYPVLTTIMALLSLQGKNPAPGFSWRVACDRWHCGVIGISFKFEV